MVIMFMSDVLRQAVWPAICRKENSCLYRPAAAAGGVVQKNVCDTPAEAEQHVDPQGRKLRLFNLSNTNTALP